MQVLDTFANGAEQSGDATMFALEHGAAPGESAEMTVEADKTKLPEVLQFIHAELERRLCPMSAQLQLDIAVEELFVNVANYAYADRGGEGMVRVSYVYEPNPGRIIVELVDSGTPFDPLAKPDAVTPDDIMAVPIGGLGILMAKKSVDELRYRRENGENVVTMVKGW